MKFKAPKDDRYDIITMVDSIRDEEYMNKVRKELESGELLEDDD